MKIAVVGLGYVGLSNALLLAQHCEVVCLDIEQHKVELLNQGRTSIEDSDVASFLKKKPLKLRATLDSEDALGDADFIVVATPTDYDAESNHFDTSSVETVTADAIRLNPQATLVIRSTVPVGFTERIKQDFKSDNIFFAPEFLREGRSLHDNLFPSRIVLGSESPKARAFAELLKRGAVKDEIPVLFTNNTEAEAIKLFSNTYLAMRVAFFNEVDTFAALKDLDSRRLIEGICLDPRIGQYYNNPSFGYGGYCLPKDSKQLLSNYNGIPQNIIQAVVEANNTRKDFIADDIVNASQAASGNPAPVIGIYRLIMKHGSDNFRASAVLGVMKRIEDRGGRLIVYEPSLPDESIAGHRLIKNLSVFKDQSSIIVANRTDPELADVADKLYTRDIFVRD